MTAARMKQTEDQIRLIVENNRFNNFFKHRDEFVKYFSAKEYLKELSHNSKDLLERELLRFYEHFFYLNYQEFSTSINKYAKKNCQKFLEVLKDSELNQRDVDLNAVSQSKIRELTEFSSVLVVLITHYTVEIIQGHMKIIREFENKTGRDEVPKIADIILINYLAKIIIDIYLFAGEGDIPDLYTNLHSNSLDYLYKIGITKINLY